MDCRSAERLIQRELDALVMGDDDRFAGPERLSAADATVLEEHCAVCPDCAGLRAELRSIDAVLAGDAVVKAPAWFATAVVREIRQPAGVRRIEPVVVSVASTLGSIAVVTSLVRTGAFAGSSGFIGRLSSVMDAWFDRVVSAISTSPGVEAVQTFQPGEVGFGVMWALAAAGAAFLAVAALRLSKELSFDRRHAALR